MPWSKGARQVNGSRRGGGRTVHQPSLALSQRWSHRVLAKAHAPPIRIAADSAARSAPLCRARWSCHLLLSTRTRYFCSMATLPVAKTCIGPKTCTSTLCEKIASSDSFQSMLHRSQVTIALRLLCRRWMSQLSKHLSNSLVHCKYVFLNAPVRSISCYKKTKKPRHTAWHDYFTDYGGDGAEPNREEEIDEMQLLSVRAAIRKLVLSEIDLLGGDPKRVAVMGHSQGGCVAYDVALSLPVTIGGLFASRCHLYSCSAADEARKDLPILHYHGAADDVIGASLALSGCSRLAALGYSQLDVRVQPRLGHCEFPCTRAEMAALAGALSRWGFGPTRVFEALNGEGGIAPLTPMRAAREAHVTRRVAAKPYATKPGYRGLGMQHMIQL